MEGDIKNGRKKKSKALIIIKKFILGGEYIKVITPPVKKKVIDEE